MNKPLRQMLQEARERIRELEVQLATSHYYYEVTESHMDGNWAVLSTAKEACLYVINRFGKVSGFDKDTPFDKMFRVSPGSPSILIWKGGFPSNLFIRRMKMDDPFVLFEKVGLMIHDSWPENFPEQVNLA